MFDSYRSSGGSIPPATKNLIIINVLIWLVMMIFPGFSNQGIMPHLALHYVGADDFNPVQILTYMFLHSTQGFWHILFNMFTLWMFGRVLERVWGSKRFLLFYFVCGIGAALVQEGVWALTWENDYIRAIAPINGLTFDHARDLVYRAIANGDGNVMAGMAAFKSSMVTVGASGAIFGLLLGFAFVFPNMPLYLFFIPIPIKAKYMVIGYGVLEFFLGISSSQSTVAHFAHLGGLLFGLILLLYWKKKGLLNGNGFY